MTPIERTRELLKSQPLQYTQFRHMNAYTSQRVLERYIVVFSYNTCVGLIDLFAMTFYEFGKYSRTTSKQCTIIASYFSCTKVYVDERVIL